MSSERYHIFWYEPVGGRNRYEATDDRAHVLEMVRKGRVNEDDEYHNVSGVRVVYGTELEFEPAEIVKTWRVKQTD